MLKLNPDKEVVERIRKALKENGGYCPCSLVQDADTKCPCKAMRENEDCECGLYVKFDFDIVHEDGGDNE